MKSFAILIAAFEIAGTAHAQQVNHDSAIMADLQKRVGEYLQMRKDIEAKSPKLKATASADKIKRYEVELGRVVHEARAHAQQGIIFTPEISSEIRRLIGIAMQSGAGATIGQSLRHAEPVHLKLKVNDRYPQHLPLQSTPPSLLENLPRLPSEMEYRITGADLVLLDAKANLIIDLIPGMFS